MKAFEVCFMNCTDFTIKHEIIIANDFRVAISKHSINANKEILNVLNKFRTIDEVKDYYMKNNYRLGLAVKDV